MQGVVGDVPWCVCYMTRSFVSYCIRWVSTLPFSEAG